MKLRGRVQVPDFPLQAVHDESKSQFLSAIEEDLEGVSELTFINLAAPKFIDFIALLHSMGHSMGKEFIRKRKAITLSGILGIFIAMK